MFGFEALFLNSTFARPEQLANNAGQLMENMAHRRETANLSTPVATGASDNRTAPLEARPALRPIWIVPSNGQQGIVTSMCPNAVESF
jgi:hypothetical protein